jgi:hypothetical protein
MPAHSSLFSMGRKKKSARIRVRGLKGVRISRELFLAKNSGTF